MDQELAVDPEQTFGSPAQATARPGSQQHDTADGHTARPRMATSLPSPHQDDSPRYLESGQLNRLGCTSTAHGTAASLAAGGRTVAAGSAVHNEIRHYSLRHNK